MPRFRATGAGLVLCRRLEVEAVDHARRVLGDLTVGLLAAHLETPSLLDRPRMTDYLFAGKQAQAVLEVYVDRILAVEDGVVASSSRLNGYGR
jgi:hypothetical protein